MFFNCLTGPYTDVLWSTCYNGERDNVSQCNSGLGLSLYHLRNRVKSEIDSVAIKSVLYAGEEKQNKIKVSFSPTGEKMKCLVC